MSSNILKMQEIIMKNPTLLTVLDKVHASSLLDPIIRFDNMENVVKLINDLRSNFIDPLLLALVQGNVQMVECILKNGQKPEGPEWFMLSLISCLFWRKNVKSRKDMLTLLIKYGFETRFHTSHVKNILHTFIRDFVRENDADAVEIVEILLNSGVSVHEFDVDGYSTLDLACATENIGLVSFLLKNKYFDVNQKNGRQETPLFASLVDASEDILKFLLSNGADVNANNWDDLTALHNACFFTDEQSTNILIKNGADVNAEDCHGETPIYSIFNEKYSYNANGALKVIVKELSRLVFKKEPVSQTNIELIQENPEVKDLFDKCIVELNRMASVKFYGRWSYLSVLNMSKSITRLSNLTKNEEFVMKFHASLHKFSNYESDLNIILNEAIRTRNESESVIARLYSTSISDLLPDLVVRKLAEYLTLADLPV